VNLQMNVIFALLLISVCYAQKFGLYGIITDFAADDTETVVRTVIVDPTSGQTLRIITNFIYVGGSATYDGISALDSDTNQFYYVTDAASAFLWNVDLAKESLLPTISLYFDYVGSLTYDNANQRLLVWGEATDPNTKKLNNYLISYPTGANTGKASLVTQFPFQQIAGSVVDSKNQIYYFVALNNSKEYIGKYDMTTNKLSDLIVPTCNITDQWYFAYDSINFDPIRGLTAVAEKANPLSYFYVTLDISGGCVAHAITPSQFGIGTCFSFDPKGPNLYMGWAPNGPGKVITYNTQTYSVTNEVALSSGFVLEDITVAYV